MADQSGNASFDPSAWEPSNRTTPLSVIWSLLGRHIAFHRRLVDLTDNVKAALLLTVNNRGLRPAMNGTRPAIKIFLCKPIGSLLIDGRSPPAFAAAKLI